MNIRLINGLVLRCIHTFICLLISEYPYIISKLPFLSMRMTFITFESYLSIILMIKLTCSSSKVVYFIGLFNQLIIQNDEIIKQPIIKSYFVGYLKNIYFILFE